jgi:hypothetical protein
MVWLLFRHLWACQRAAVAVGSSGCVGQPSLDDRVRRCVASAGGAALLCGVDKIVPSVQ